MNTTRILAALLVSCLLVAFVACEGADPRRVGEFCLEEGDCESGLCYDSKCLNPDEDYDGDSLKNGIEKNITGTDYGVADTDGDGADDGMEVGGTPTAATDTDGDGINDAIESLAISADPDKDCIPDQYDPDNGVADVDSVKVASLHCSRVGVCGAEFDKVTATCDAGEPVCDYSAVTTWEAAEATCDAKDNDCDGKTDEDLTAPDVPECLSGGVCAGRESDIFRICKGGTWQCEYTAIDEFEKVESSCDGFDNNCDGVPDDGLVDQICFNRNEYGKCAGLTVCTIYEGVMCDGPEPKGELCNLIDDNCDGSTDEGLTGVECTVENDFGACMGVTACDMSTGGTACTAEVPAMESCDTVDNDCDGETDEELICDRTSTLKVIVYGATLPPVTLTGSITGPAYAPLTGATVNFFADNCPETGATEGVVPAWTGTSDANGVLLMPIQPGFWCIQVMAEGYQTLQSYSLEVPESAYIPLDIVLLLNGMTSTQLSLCGRVVEAPDLVAEVSGSTDVEIDLKPVAAALVTLTGATSETEIATTTSDIDGYWCMYGLPSIPDDGQVTLTGTRDSYYPTGFSFTMAPNILYFQTIVLSKLDVTETECLFEGFEVPLATAGWTTASDTTQSSTWNGMQSAPCVAQGYAMECAMPFANEIDAAAQGTLLCPNPEQLDNSCIPATGSLLTAHAGTGFAWFGDQKTCSYAAPITACGDLTKRVTGSLESPWIDGTGAWTLYMTFMSAWEVESISPETDIMYVEAQTSPMSESGTWSVVGLVKEMAPYTPEPVKRAAATGSWTSGGTDSAPIWQWYSVDLSAFKGEWFRVRFRFDSVDDVFNYFRGWQIDDVAVRGVGCGQSVAL